MPAAEVILTFNIDAFIQTSLPMIRSPRRLSIESAHPMLSEADRSTRSRKAKGTLGCIYRPCLYQDLVESCGARFYTVFFIRTEGHGDYWLVHLSQHPRARDVMTQVHWSKNNHFIHYGGAGIDMFRVWATTPNNDSSLSQQGSIWLLF